MSDCVAGVDLGGTTVTCALANRAGQVLAEQTIPTQSHEGPEAVLDRIAATVLKLAESSGQSPSSAGMGVPGLVDLETGTTRFLPNLPTNWRDVPAGARLAGALNCPVSLLNDVRTATLGELTYGRGQQAKTMVFFAVGTGIGGGVVIDGRLHLGPLGAAGELGHQTVLPDGPPCGCGNHGCLETLASAPAITAEGVRLLRSGMAPELHRLVNGNADHVSPRTMAAAAEAGDRTIGGAIERAGQYLAIGVANMIVALHPELVVIGGGVAQMGDTLLEPLRRAVASRVHMIPIDTVRIETSALGDRAGVMGAIALAAYGLGGSA